MIKKNIKNNFLYKTENKINSNEIITSGNISLKETVFYHNNLISTYYIFSEEFVFYFKYRNLKFTPIFNEELYLRLFNLLQEKSEFGFEFNIEEVLSVLTNHISFINIKKILREDSMINYFDKNELLDKYINSDLNISAYDHSFLDKKMKIFIFSDFKGSGKTTIASLLKKQYDKKNKDKVHIEIFSKNNFIDKINYINTLNFLTSKNSFISIIESDFFEYFLDNLDFIDSHFDCKFVYISNLSEKEEKTFARLNKINKHFYVLINNYQYLENIKKFDIYDNLYFNIFSLNLGNLEKSVIKNFTKGKIENFEEFSLNEKLNSILFTLTY